MAEMTETRAKIELFKVAKDTYGDVHYFKTLQEAKDLVDKMRESHDFDYGFIMRVEAIYVDEHTVEDETEIGDWGEFEEEWETAAAQIANDGTARVRTEPEPDTLELWAEIDLDNALHPQGYDWSFDKPNVPYKTVYIIRKDDSES